jgi:hypothetical protein
MALTVEEQKFVDWVKKIIPRHYFSIPRAEEIVGSFAKMFGAVHEFDVERFEQALISTATDLPPDFLDLHARDRNSMRSNGEADNALRTRLSAVLDAITKPALLDAIDDILEAASVTGSAAMVELRKDRAFFLTNVAMSGTGGTFTLVSGSTYKFTPTVAFTEPPDITDNIIFSGAANAGNNGTFAITELIGAAASYINVSGVAGADATVSWSTQRKSLQGYSIEGFKDAYHSRGYRMTAGLKPSIIIILPYGSTASVEAAVRAMLVLRKGAGVFTLVERRLNP